MRLEMRFYAFLTILFIVKVTHGQLEECPSCCFHKFNNETIKERPGLPFQECSDNEESVISIGRCMSACLYYLPPPKIFHDQLIWPVLNNLSYLTNPGQLQELQGCFGDCLQVINRPGYCNNCNNKHCTLLCGIPEFEDLLNDTVNVNRPSAPVNPAFYSISGNKINIEPRDSYVADLDDGRNMGSGSGDPRSVQSISYNFIIKVYSPNENKTSYCPLMNNFYGTNIRTIDHLCTPTQISYAVVNLYGKSDYSPVTTECLGNYSITDFNLIDFKTCVSKDLRSGYEGHHIVKVSWTDHHPPHDPLCIGGYIISLFPEQRLGCENNQQITDIKLDRHSKSYEFRSSNTSIKLFDGLCPEYRIMVTVKDAPIELINQKFEMKLTCSDRPKVHMDLQPIRQPDCSYRLNVIFRVEYDVDVLQTMDKFHLGVTTRTNSRSIIRRTVTAHDASALVKPNYPAIKNFSNQCDVPYKHYNCEEACAAMGLSSNTTCLSSCHNVTFYQVQIGYTFIPNPVEDFIIILDTKHDFFLTCLPVQVSNTINFPVCPPNPPININFEVIELEGRYLTVYISWNISFIGNISQYVVYVSRADDPTMYNGTVFLDGDKFKITTNTSINTTFVVHPYTDLLLQIRADTIYANTALSTGSITAGNWSDPIYINVTKPGQSSDDSGSGVPSFIYYIIGFGLGLLFIIFLLILVCTVCRNMRDRWYDKSELGDTICASDIPLNLIQTDWCSMELPSDEWELNPEAVVMQNLLGTGNFGEVYKAVISGPVSIPGYTSQEVMTPVAVKLLQANASCDMKHDFLKEIAMMKKVASGKNPFVVNMIGCCIQQEPLALVLEYVPNGNLLEYLRESRAATSALARVEKANGFTSTDDDISKAKDYENSVTTPKAKENDYVEDRLTNVNGPVGRRASAYASIGSLESGDLVQFAWQIASGMNYLQSLKIIHRDLACRNVLVGDGKRLKLSDFGLARSLAYTDVYTKTSDGKLPIRWMALESVTDRTFTHQSDVWSYGITLWEISTLGGYPYPSVSNNELLPALINGYRLECPKNCSKQIYDMMLRCWNHDPLHRPSFEELQDELDTMLSAEQRDQYIQINSVDEPYCQMFPAQSSENGDQDNTEDTTVNGILTNIHSDQHDRQSITEEEVAMMPQAETTDSSV